MTYKHTFIASCIGFVAQAVVNNLLPLFFVIIRAELGLSLQKLTIFITVNFCVQIIADLFAAKYSTKVGIRKMCILAHVLTTMGLIGITLFPVIITPFVGILLAVILNSIGGGILEVLLSPIVESIPGDKKSGAMSLLHSFYSWGHVSVILITTTILFFFGKESWRYIPLFWAIIPLFNTFLFSKVPLAPLPGDEKPTKIRKIISIPQFLLLVIAMICSGASEQSMVQWASFFAETALNVSKTVGDIAGPCAFAVLMGISRTIFAVHSHKYNLHKALISTSVLCVASYLVVSITPNPVISLFACAICGFSVGIMWPAVFSTAAITFPSFGTSMFALLAFAGDIGCASGPTTVGLIANKIESLGTSSFARLFNISADSLTISLKTGLFFATLFPILLIISIYLLHRFPYSKK